MIYPPFIQKKDTIGICAPSAGSGNDIASHDASVKVLTQLGYRIKETASVRVNGLRSSTAEIRAEELLSLFKDPDVSSVLCASGGDFLFEILPYVDFKTIKKKPKWLSGMSDPTGILFPLTVKYDVASLYGINLHSFYPAKAVPAYVQNFLNIEEGKNVIQHSSSSYSGSENLIKGVLRFNKRTAWKSTVGNTVIEGRCIGGCIDVLKDLIGTEYDAVHSFTKKYSKDGIVWFFDNYALSAEVFYRTLLQMRYAGWFENCTGVLIGRVLFSSSETGMTYKDAILKALPDMPVLYDADIGHTFPAMTMIAGSIVKAKYHNGHADISFVLR